MKVEDGVENDDDDDDECEGGGDDEMCTRSSYRFFLSLNHNHNCHKK
jgi:hypothetical protein